MRQHTAFGMHALSKPDFKWNIHKLPYNLLRFYSIYCLERARESSFDCMALANELYAAPRIYEALIIGPIFAGAHKQNNKKRWIAMKPHFFLHCNFMVYSKICREILTKIYNQYQGFMACTLNCTLMSLPLVNGSNEFQWFVSLFFLP